MQRVAQVFALLFATIFAVAAVSAIFFPANLGEASGFNPTSDYGLTNVRTLGAPLLMLAVVTAFGAFRKDWIMIVPASLYFFFNGSSRVVSLIFEQYDPIMIRGLLLTFGLFSLSQLVIYILRKTQTVNIRTTITS